MWSASASFGNMRLEMRALVVDTCIRKHVVYVPSRARLQELRIGILKVNLNRTRLVYPGAALGLYLRSEMPAHHTKAPWLVARHPLEA